MTKREVQKAIRERFRIKGGDNLPYTGWLRSKRVDISRLMGELGCFKYGAEIGVREGRHAKVLFDNIPELKLVGVDPWTPYRRHSQERQDQCYQNTLTRLAGRDIQIIKKTSVEASKDIEDGSLDFVYIDGFHDFDWVMTDLILWVPKVRPGGIVSGHDYYYFFKSGVVQAVDAYVKAHNITEWYITKEKECSFFWVR